jgi:hypothetical protein
MVTLEATRSPLPIPNNNKESPKLGKEKERKERTPPANMVALMIGAVIKPPVELEC